MSSYKLVARKERLQQLYTPVIDRTAHAGETYRENNSSIFIYTERKLYF